MNAVKDRNVVSTPVASHLQENQEIQVVVETDLVFPFPTVSTKKDNHKPVIEKLIKETDFKSFELGRIGYESSNDFERGDAVLPEFEKPRDEHIDKLINGSSRLGYITKNGVPFNYLSDVTDMLLATTKLIGVKKIFKGNHLYLFELSDDYEAFASEVRMDALLLRGFKESIRVEFSQEHSFKLDRINRIYYTPAKGPYSIPMQETRLLSFVTNEDTGLVLWQPGQYIGSLRHDELRDWVFISLFDK